MMVAAVMVLGVTACGRQNVSANTGEDETMEEGITGGWSRPASSEITDEARAVFEKAMQGLEGVSYVPVALLGTQVVAGMNYCFLCEATGVYPGAETTYVRVYIYEDLDGNAEMTEMVDVEEPVKGHETVQIPNPFVDYDSLESAAAAGFPMLAPDTVEGYRPSFYKGRKYLWSWQLEKTYFGGCGGRMS